VEQYQTEEEQLETLRKWWEENGKSTIAAIVLALGAGFGWQGWQDYRQGQSEQASAVYEEMLQALNPVEGAVPTQEQLQTGRHLANTLKDEFPRSTYARFAALHLARVAVQESNLDAAEAELRWVLESGPADEVEAVARLRLARVLSAAGEYDAAAALLAEHSVGFEGAFAEARGDLLLARGETDAAREEFQRALASGAGAGGGGSRSLQLKLESLNPLTPRTLAAQSAGSEEDAAVADDAQLVVPDAAGTEEG
jgi:predicted negative regulator of RcsB-dependent stress response